MKIKVLNVIGALNTGGAETMLVNILRTINRNKFDIYFLCYSDEKFDYEDEVNELGGKIIRIKSLQKLGLIRFMREIERVINEYGIDVVHCHTYFNSAFAVLAAKRCGVKIIAVHSHNTKPDNHFSIVKSIYFALSRRIICKNATHRIACGEDAGRAMFGGRDFFIFNNGIMPEKYAYSEKSRNKIREELKIDKGIKIVGHVGRFSEQKNHEFILEIFNKLHERDNNYKLLLVGQGHLMPKIREIVSGYGLEESVCFLGLRKDVGEIYSAMDVFLFPSLFEGLPLTLIEAQTSGVPIVASDVIDRGADLTKSIKFLSLTKPIDTWCDALCAKTGERYLNNYDIIAKSEYAMVNGVRKLESIYEGKDIKK